MDNKQNMIYISILMLSLLALIVNTALFFIVIKDGADAKQESVVETEVSYTPFQQKIPNQEEIFQEVENMPPKEEVKIEEPVKQGIPEKYKEYLEDVNVINEFLKENPQFVDSIKSMNEKGVNIVADDVSFYIEFNEGGLIKDINTGTINQYKTISIHDELDNFLQNAENAENIEQFRDLILGIDIPFKYYLKIPQIISYISDRVIF